MAEDFQLPINDTNFEEVPQRVSVVCSSITVLWDYQPELESKRLEALTRYLVSSFVENFVQQKESRVFLTRAVMFSIREMAKKNKALAKELLVEFFNAKVSLLSQMSDYEKLEFAEDLLAVDVQKSQAIAESVLLRSIPSRTISYLGHLKVISRPAYLSLFSKIVSIIALGGIYSIHDELVLQSYIFKEQFTAYPINEKSDVPGFSKLAFSVSGVDVNEVEVFRDQATEPDEVRKYAAASVSGLSKRKSLIRDAFGGAQAYFLVSKLVYYVKLREPELQLFNGAISALDADVATRALGFGVTKENMEHLRFMALSVILNQFGSSVSDIANDNLDESSDSITKARMLESSILRAIAQKKFESARKLLFGVIDKKTNQALEDFLTYSVIVDLAKKGQLVQIENIGQRLDAMSNFNVKVITAFEIARALIRAGNREAARPYLAIADSTITSSLENSEKAQMLIGLLKLQSALDKRTVPSGTLSAILRTLTTQNVEADDHRDDVPLYALAYRGDSIKMFSHGVADGGIRYEFSDSSIEDGFEGAARIDWENALNFAKSIEFKPLRNRAVLAVCRMQLASH